MNAFYMCFMVPTVRVDGLNYCHLSGSFCGTSKDYNGADFKMILVHEPFTAILSRLSLKSFMLVSFRSLLEQYLNIYDFPYLTSYLTIL